VSDVLKTRWGERWLLRNLLLLAPLVSLAGLAQSAASRRQLLAGIGLAGGAGYLAITSSVSHSAAGKGAFWAASSDFVHLLAASLWIGMLALLVLTFVWVRRNVDGGERYPLLAAALQRFSALATLSVALLLVTGTLNAVIEVDRLNALIDSAYGRTLLVKLLLLLPLLGIGAYNGYLLRPRLVEEAEAQASRDRLSLLGGLEARLGRTVRWELGVAVTVLAVVALLVQTTPTRGRLSAPEQAGRYVETVETPEVQATLVIDPNQPGVNSFEVYLTGAVETVERVRLDFFLPGSDVGESRLILDTTNLPTYYVGKGPLLTQAGKWKVVVDLRRTSGSDLQLPFAVRVSGPGGSVSARGGGAFALPVSLTATHAALIGVVTLLCAALVAGSFLPAAVVGGYASLLAEAVSERISVTRLRPIWSLAALLVFGVGLGLIVGAHVHPRLSEEEAAKENPIASSAESIARGEMLFLQNCSQCHGESGRGDGPLAGSLTLKPANLYDHIPYHPDNFFYGVMTNGLGGVMPSFKSSISDEDRWNILNYLRDRFGRPPATE
jgi:copper transport protein